MKQTKRLKDTTKAELVTALKAAQAEITRLVGEVTTHQDAGRFLSKELDQATEILKGANDRNQVLEADMAVAVRAVGEVTTANKDLESIITSLQADLTAAKNQLADFEADGITQDVLTCPVNLSALRRVLDASEVSEPVFVLRARDKAAPDVVEWWANRAVAIGATNHRKVGQALARAADMRRWQDRNGCRIPD